MSPRTQLLFLALFIAVLVTTIMYLLDIPLGLGYSRFAFVLVISVFVIYVLLARIADKLRHPKIGDL